MKKPGLDQRHRDRNGEISRKHGNTLIRTLRRIYGSGFAPTAKDTDKLSDALQGMDDISLSQLDRHHEQGELDRKIADAAIERLNFHNTHSASRSGG